MDPTGITHDHSQWCTTLELWSNENPGCPPWETWDSVWMMVMVASFEIKYSGWVRVGVCYHIGEGRFDLFHIIFTPNNDDIHPLLQYRWYKTPHTGITHRGHLFKEGDQYEKDSLIRKREVSTSPTTPTIPWVGDCRGGKRSRTLLSILSAFPWNQRMRIAFKQL